MAWFLHICIELLFQAYQAQYALKQTNGFFFHFDYAEGEIEQQFI